MPMSPRIESRVQELHFGAHGRKARPAVLLARFLGGAETNSYPLLAVGFPGRFLSVASKDQVLRDRVQRHEADGTEEWQGRRQSDQRRLRYKEVPHGQAVGWRAGRSALVVSRGCAILPLPPDIREPSPRRRPPGPRR